MSFFRFMIWFMLSGLLNGFSFMGLIFAFTAEPAGDLAVGRLKILDTLKAYANFFITLDYRAVPLLFLITFVMFCFVSKPTGVWMMRATYAVPFVCFTMIALYFALRSGK